MRTIGRWSIASVINFIVSFMAFAAAFATLVAICVLFAVPFIKLPITVTVPVSFSVDAPAEILASRPNWGFEFRETRRPPAPSPRRLEHIEGSVRLPDSNRWFIFANGVALIAILIYVVLVLGKLRAVLRTLIFDGKPFVAANAARIRFIGLAVLAGELARMLFVFFENIYARQHLVMPGVSFDMLPRFSLRTVILGLLILVIAEVFRAGTQLDEDQSLTI